MKSAFSVHNIFGDHMVLQRRKPIRVAGTAFRGSKIRGRLDNAVAKAETDPEGEWVLEFPPMEAGGPYILTITNQEGVSLVFRDILIGEVWFCSGQSNMEYHVHCPSNRFYGLPEGAELVASAHDDGLRLLQIPRCIAPDEPCTENPTGSVWKPATTSEAVTPFSAVGYYFGLKLRAKLGVPVGLINGSWGGTKIEPWIPRAGYLAAGEGGQLKVLDESLRDQFVPRDPDAPPFDPFGGAYRDWIVNKFRTYAPDITADALANWMKPGNEPDKWTNLSGLFGSVLTNVGVVWFRCEVELPPECAGRNAVLHCDFCDDCDEAYVDGERVGETSAFVPNFWSLPRDYSFTLKPSATGRHTIAWRLSNHYNVGLFGDNVALLVPGVCEKPLAKAAWQYRVEYSVDQRKVGVRPMPESEPGAELFGCQTPTTLYNAMVHPSTFMNIRGAIWYQGCSNASAPDWYAVLQGIQIDSWRKAWRDPDMPFLITQLAAFSGRHRPEARLPDDFWKEETPWSNLGYAPFRQMQSGFLDNPGVGVACAIDVGDHSDIHPANKKAVGFRLAHEAMRLAYGDASSLPGPRFASARRVPGGVEVVLRDCGSGLVVDGGAIGPHLFAVHGEGGKSAWTDAELRPDGTLFVKDGGVGEVNRVEYAYSAFPPNPPLRRKDDGLPVFPFSAVIPRDNS